MTAASTLDRYSSIGFLVKKQKRKTRGLAEPKVTMAVIAAEAGLSLSTVSLALRGNSSIPIHTRRRVLNLARELGYVPRRGSVLGIRSGLKNVGLVVKTLPENPQDNPFYSIVQAGVEMACRAHRLNVLYASLPVDEDSRITDVPRLFSDGELNGLLLVGVQLTEQNAAIFERLGVPIVLVDAYAESHAHDSVVSANFEGAYEAVSYLARLGHRRIALVGSHPRAFPSIAQRQAGYERALDDHGIHERHYIDCSLVGDAAFAAALRYFESGPPVTAVFGVNDEVAIWAMRAAKSLGRLVPQDISFAGFDDDLLAAHVEPPLTTMQVDKLGMGRHAIDLLINRAEHPDAAVVETVLRPRLIERESVLALSPPPGLR